MRRGERWLIRHVDLSVPRGELVYLIGANGAGKSTCAKAILGLIDIDEGTIERSSELSVGYVPQRLAVSHTLPLTVRRLMKLTGRFPAPDIDAALTAVGLERLGDPPVTSLSGGELQRLLIARALIHRPDLLVLDEPAQGVDVAGAGVLHDLIDGIRRDLGCGVLLISHDLQMVMDTDNDVIVLVPHEHDESPLGPRSPHRLRARAAVRREAEGMLDDFLVRALLAGIGLALVTGPAGCFVVWRHLAYFGETIAHSALLGVVLALVLRVDLVIDIFASACAVTLLMFYLQRRGTLPADTVLGLLAHGGLAVGLVTLAFFPHIRVDLQALLFGDILAVSRTDLAVIWGGGALVLLVLGRIWRPLLAATVNPDLATVAGLQPERTRLTSRSWGSCSSSRYW